MVATYTIFGRQVGSHVLAIATLSVTGIGAYLGLRGGSKPPPISAKKPVTDKEEEQFIKEFLKNIEAEEQKAKN